MYEDFLSRNAGLESTNVDGGSGANLANKRGGAVLNTNVSSRSKILFHLSVCPRCIPCVCAWQPSREIMQCECTPNYGDGNLSKTWTSLFGISHKHSNVFWLSSAFEWLLYFLDSVQMSSLKTLKTQKKNAGAAWQPPMIIQQWPKIPRS